MLVRPADFILEGVLRERVPGRRVPRTLRLGAVRGRVIQRDMALGVVCVSEVHMPGFGAHVQVEVGFGLEINAFALSARPSAAVFDVKTRQVLEEFVERLLLVFVGLSQSQDLMRAELSDSVPLENVVLSDPIELTVGVVLDSFHL